MSECGATQQLGRRLTCGCKSPNCPHLVQHLFHAHRPIRRDANDEGPTAFLTCRLPTYTTDRILVPGDRGRNYLRLRRKNKALRDPLLGWVVAAKSATAGRTGRAPVSLRANWAFGSMSSLTQLVLGSPKNHSRSGGSKSFMVNWPAVSLVFGQGALFGKREVNFPEEGAERSRPPKGQVPIRPGAETGARGRPAGGSTKGAVLLLLLSSAATNCPSRVPLCA